MCIFEPRCRASARLLSTDRVPRSLMPKTTKAPRANQLPSPADTLTLRRVGVMPFLKGLIGPFFAAFENVFG
jgi:hypothetical protein